MKIDDSYPLIPRENLLYKGSKKIPETFSEDQINSMIQKVLISDDYLNNDWGRWMRWRDACIIATIYLLGLRPKEACRLRFDDFNMRTMLVKIQGTSNKNRKDRIIPVPSKLMKFYHEYFRFPYERFWKGSRYLFPSYMNNHISTKRIECTIREKVLKPLGLWKIPLPGKRKSETSTYTLRHSRASHIMKKQIEQHGIPDLFSIANLLGHADLRTTANFYLATDEKYMDYLRKQVNL